MGLYREVNYYMAIPNISEQNNMDAVNHFETKGYTIETNQEKFELTITKDSVKSTDIRFMIDDIALGNNYEPIDTYFVPEVGEPVYRKRNKGEKRISNQTLPRLACQIFEKELMALSDLDKKQFPVCKYKNQDYIRGIFPSKEAYKEYRNSMEFLIYRCENEMEFVIYSWNVFSTVIFAQECLKRFGKSGDKFVLVYKNKADNELVNVVEEKEKILSQECKNPYSKILLESKNIIFRGAPGTGKSYLSKEIAADIISNGYTHCYSDLTDEQKKQVEFVQFHPSYDYSDFVEGLRPKINDDGSMGFELQDGIFKKFVARARKNYENSQKTKEVIEQENTTMEAISDFFNSINFGVDEFKTITGNKFYITDVDEKRIYISIPGNETKNKLTVRLDEIRQLIEANINLEKVMDIQLFFGTEYGRQHYSYELTICEEIEKRKKNSEKCTAKLEELRNYVFIIDEINRGEISKILGELFFSIDPGYRGEEGAVSTQYANMHSDPNKKFYIPDNVYIIGTMNDIDRSVDSFDFAMRRRFRFIEIKADDTQDMLEALNNEELKNEAIERMDKLNAEILKVDGLNENYQIGASYFLKLRILTFDELWTDCLKPLLQDYIRGMYDEEGIMERFARAYGYKEPIEGDANESIQN